MIAARFGSVTVINLYVPNGSEVGSDRFAFKISWLARLKAYLVARYEPTDKLVLCGDFNVALEDRDVYDPGELAGSILFSEQEKEAASALMEFGFSDVFRRHVEEPGHYSWWDYRQGAFRRNLGLRIDHLWATSPVAERSISCWIDRETRKLPRPSDHAPVVGVFDLRSATWEQTLLAL